MGEGFVETNGVRLWYDDSGSADGDVIVLIMGAMASAISWPPDLLDALIEAGYRVVRFDNRDIGLSSHVDFSANPYDLDDMATDTVGLLDALGIERAHLVGVSMGGMISQIIALREPARVRSLTLIITSPGPNDEQLAPMSAEIAEIAMREAVTDAEVSQRTTDLFRALNGSRFPFDEAAFRELAAADAARGTNPNSAHALAALGSPSRVDQLAGIGVPTLVIHGTEDPILPYDHGETLAKEIPNATLITWEGVGHELPAQLVPELTSALLDHVRLS